MAVSVSGQVLLFLLSCLVGAALGLAYDLFRIIRMLLPCSRAALTVLDILFFILCAAVTFLFLLLHNSGGIRAYLIEGELLGALVYSLTIGRLIIRASRLATARLRRGLHVCGERIGPPVRRFERFVGDGIRKRAEKTGEMCKKGRRGLKTRLKVGRDVMYNHIYKKSRGKLRRRRPTARPK